MGSIIHGALSSLTKYIGCWRCFLLDMEPSAVHHGVELVFLRRFYFYSGFPSQ